MVLEILLVEDDDAEVYLVRMALASWKTPFNLHVVSNAEAALDFLNRSPNYPDAPRPHLALVDLNLPKAPGFAVLEAIRQRPELKNTAVVVLSSSTAPDDVSRALPLASAYFQKPMEYEAVVRLFEALETVLRMDVRFAMKPTSHTAGQFGG